jgi:hypothetical protein
LLREITTRLARRIHLWHPAQLVARQDVQLERVEPGLLFLPELDMANTEGLRRTRRPAHFGHLTLSRDERTSRSN